MHTHDEAFEAKVLSIACQAEMGAFYDELKRQRTASGDGITSDEMALILRHSAKLKTRAANVRP